MMVDLMDLFDYSRAETDVITGSVRGTPPSEKVRR